MKLYRSESVIMLALLLLIFAILPASAEAERCYTGCKDGPKEHSSGITWVCNYDRVGNNTGFGQIDLEDYSYSVCKMTIRGQYKNYLQVNGKAKSFRECLTDYCIPKVEEVCGERDRCADQKNWLKH